MSITTEPWRAFVLVAPPHSHPCPFPSFVITVALSRKHEPAQLCINQQVGQRPGVDIGRQLGVLCVWLVMWRGLLRFLFSGYQHAEEKQDSEHCHSRVYQVDHGHSHSFGFVTYNLARMYPRVAICLKNRAVSPIVCPLVLATLDNSTTLRSVENSNSFPGMPCTATHRYWPSTASSFRFSASILCSNSVISCSMA